MAARIYSLAKELKIDSKELVDLCAKAGIAGKGSALASLDDDEVTRLKEFLGNRGRGSERSAPAAQSASGSATAVAAPPGKQTLTREHYMPPAGVAGARLRERYRMGSERSISHGLTYALYDSHRVIG